MVRTQIQLTEDQFRALKQLSASSEKSIADLVRRSVELLLLVERTGNQQQRGERAIRTLGKFSSGLADVGVNHDKYLDEAFGEW